MVGHQEFCLVAAKNGIELPGDKHTQGKGETAAGIAPRASDLVIKDPDGNSIRIEADPALEGSGLRAIKSLTISVADMDRSTDFYGNILGLPLASEGAGYVCHLSKGELRLVLHNKGLIPGSCDFCLITQQDIENVYANLVNAPLVANLGVVDRHGAHGPIRSVYLRDPDGNLVEIAQYVK